MSLQSSVSQLESIDFVERARALVPQLSERANATEQERQVPETTIEAFHEAGFFRLLQPKRWGGFEEDPRVFFDVLMEIAGACPSSAWVLGVVSVHNWQLALFDEKAQADVWANDARTLISSSYMPVGKVRMSDGGYQLSGKWGFSSGCDACQWVFLGAFVPPAEEGGRPEMRTFLLPRKDYTIVDDWHVSGLAGTGSKSVVVENVFVPEHRTHVMTTKVGPISPGAIDSPLYRIPFGQLFTRTVATPAVGMARAALEHFKELSLERRSRADGKRALDDPTTAELIAQSEAVLDEVLLVLHRDYERIIESAFAGDPLSTRERVAYRYHSSTATDACAKLVSTLFAASGGQAIYTEHPLNRLFQSVHAARAHYANNPFKSARNYGGVELGLDTTDHFI